MRRLALGLTVALLCLGACGGLAGGQVGGGNPTDSSSDPGEQDSPSPASSPTEPPSAVMTFTAGNRPSAELTPGQERQEAELGTHCWTSGDSGLCADYAGVVAPKRAIEVPAGTELRVEGEATSVDGVIGVYVDHGGWGDVNSKQELKLGDGSDTIRVDPGEYVISLFTVWDQGDAALAFRIVVT